MSRIFRYQSSVDKFIRTKSSLKDMSEDNKQIWELIYKNLDHLIPISSITIINKKIRKKEKMKFHGYFIASGVEIALAIAHITDRYCIYRDDIPLEKFSNFVSELVAIMYQSLAGNVDSLKLNVSIKETFRISQYCVNYMSKHISNLTRVETTISNKRIKKTDFTGYKFKKAAHRIKYASLKYVSDEDLTAHIDHKYGFVCKMALVFGWLFGLGEEKKIADIEKLGTCFGVIFKIAYDFEHIDDDLENCDDHTFNIVINKGIKESFSMFMVNKAKLAEGILAHGIWNDTIKEILDLAEKSLDAGIECASIDEKYTYSDFSEIGSTMSR